MVNGIHVIPNPPNIFKVEVRKDSITISWALEPNSDNDFFQVRWAEGGIQGPATEESQVTIDSGASQVSLWLGHAHMQTTEIYLRADPMEKIEAIEAVTPPSLRRGSLSQISSSPRYAGPNYYGKRSKPTTPSGAASTASTFHNNAHSIRTIMERVP
jgi:hypothetical protein